MRRPVAGRELHVDLQRHQLCRRGLAQWRASRRHPRGVHPRHLRRDRSCTAGGPNALAVRVSPPPHPGIPHEQSVAAGPGENGGNLAIDGPTFVATEGWDWIPAIRDRDTGIWQSVELAATGRYACSIRRSSPGCRYRVSTRPTSSSCAGREPRSGGHARHDRSQLRGRARTQDVLLEPGVTESASIPASSRSCAWRSRACGGRTATAHPSLYRLRLDVSADGAPSDSKQLHFGVREITYELSLFDHSGRLRRVEVDPAAGQRTPPAADRRASRSDQAHRQRLGRIPDARPARLHPRCADLDTVA